ncbi:Hypothetical protein NTJ_09791 [Nesidiocoris tenuis]|uniref:Uncharacterized protein n=1 Tax=Nesidiocoris tenuis TaxID=355587 RepID=A0ABN7AY99_9HEMI|nr:Hypothetical protein NTJ_09791 [Nesidiocoris tenuis]
MEGCERGRVQLLSPSHIPPPRRPYLRDDVIRPPPSPLPKGQNAVFSLETTGNSNFFLFSAGEFAYPYKQAMEKRATIMSIIPHQRLAKFWHERLGFPGSSGKRRVINKSLP